MSSSRWGPRVAAMAENNNSNDDERMTPPPPSFEDRSSSQVSLAAVPAPVPNPPTLPDADVEFITETEWGPRPGEDGYDTDQDYAPRPRQERRGEPCNCHVVVNPSQPPQWACRDDSCILYACQEECRSNCPAGMYCGNKRLQNADFKPLQVFDAQPKGHGVQVLVDVKKGDVITEYVGKAVKQSALHKLFRRYQYDRRLYIMSLDTAVLLDARQKGGLARYINHSCQPNCKVERWKVRGILRAAVVSLEDIPANTELTFDYQWERRRGRAPTKCHCGAPKCRGTLEVLAESNNCGGEQQQQAQQQQVLLNEGNWKKITSPDIRLVNRTVKVFSKQHGAYVLGHVTEYNGENGTHRILYQDDLREVWQDLQKEDWMMLDEEDPNIKMEDQLIAKKQPNRRPSPTGSETTATLLQAVAMPDSSRCIKHYLYVQTPIKEAFWSKRLIERCERNCQVQVQAQQMARPPFPPNMEDPEDMEKYQALDQSMDGTVWKLSISGSDVARAHSILLKNVVYLQKTLEQEALRAQQQQQPAMAANRTLAANTAPSSLDAHEVVLPRLIVDAVKRKLASIRDKCRNVNIQFAPSESKSKQFSRLVIDGSLLSDIQTAKEQLWTVLVALCVEANVPTTPNKIHRDLGFLGGALSNEQFQLLASSGASNKNPLKQDAKEDLYRTPFFASFESTYRCTVWIQSDEDMGRINSSNQLVNEAASDTPRKVFFGCDPKEVPRLWNLLQSRAAELARGVKFFYLGADRVYQPLMMKNGGEFFEYVKQVTGASVTIDSMTGDHLRIDGRPQSDTVDMSLWEDGVQELSEKERAGLAEEIVRLQIELYRDHSIREQSWIFGRDWTLVASSVPSSSDGESKQTSLSLGTLDNKSAAQGCMEMSETVANLGLGSNVAAHAAIILYRFLCVGRNAGTRLKAREAVLACVFMANKAQKAKKWKKLDDVLEAGYQTFYPGAKFDPNKEEVLVLEEKVIAAEKEILEALDYDIFWCDTEWIRVAATGSGKMKSEQVEKVFVFAFSGPAVGAGAELWLKYGVEYVFAVAAAFLKADLEHLLPALSLIPLKVSQAAELFVESAKLGRASTRKELSHPLLEGGKDRLEKYLPRIKEVCVESMKKGLLNRSSAVATASSASEQRYRIVGDRNRRRHAIRAVPSDVVRQHIIPMVDVVAAESTCSIFIQQSSQPAAEDIILEGSWRAVAIAERILRDSSNGAVIPASVDTTAELEHNSKLQAKVQPGLLRMGDIQTIDGWEGTIQAEASKHKAGGRRIGGKCAIAGKIAEPVLRDSGLRWWAPPQHGPSPSGSIKDMFLVRSSQSGEQLDALGTLAKTFVGQSEAFPLLTSRMTRPLNGAGKRSVALSIQRWPSEKVGRKELEVAKKSKKKKVMQMGFSAAALRELQILTQLHGIIPSPRGHPNFVLPIGVSVPASDDEAISASTKSPTSGGLLSSDDPMFSLFRSSEENEKAVEREKKAQGCPHLVLDPTPLVFQRFLSRSKKRESKADQVLSIGLPVLAAWFHDLLSMLVHCHTNHVILRTIQADQFVVDHSGVLKIAVLYRATVLPAQERDKSLDPVLAAKSSKSKKDGDKDDDSSNPYAAPEILLGCPKFSKESDVWAIGCLLASLLLSKPIFVGKDRNSLLKAQYKIVGTPSPKNYEDANRYPRYTKPDKKYKRGVVRALEHMLKGNESLPQYSKAIDLIAGMLHLDPTKRFTAAQALGHDFLVEYSENCNSDTFRQQYASDWMSLKHKLLVQPDGSERDDTKEKEKSRKRKAMMIAASKTTGEEGADDLYDMDELFNES